MGNKRVVPMWLSVILLILCAVSAMVSAYQAVSLFGEFPIAAVFHIIMVLTNLAAISYCVGGYKKNAAGFFKLVCFLLTLTAAFSVVDVIVYYNTHVLALVSAVMLIIVRLCFVFGKDLGKTRSLIMAFFALALMLIFFCNSIALGSSLWISTLLRIVVDVVFLVMVCAKYQDKAARGTK